MVIKKEILTRYANSTNEEKGDVLIGSGKSSDFEIPDESSRIDVKQLEWYYWNFGPLFRSLNLKASSVWGRGFKIVCKNEEKKKLCEKATLMVPGFKRWFIIECLHAFGFGNGPGEIIWDDINVIDKNGNVVLDENNFIKKKEEGTNIVGYNITDYKTFKPKWDAQGYVTYWEQKISSTLGDNSTINHKPRKICHFKFAQIADNVNGIGLIETNIHTIKALLTAQKSSNDLLFRHGVPFAHVVKTGATAKDIPKLSRIGQKFSSSTNLASSEKIEVKLIGIQGKSVDIQPHIDQLQDNFSGGIGIPKAITFFSGNTVNRATLTELLTETSTEIMFNQEILSDVIEQQIFVPLLEANGFSTDEDFPQVVWNPLDKKSETEIYANFKIIGEVLTKMVQAGIYTNTQVKIIMDEKLKVNEN